MNYETLKSWSIPEVRQEYSARDTILYNLGVGAGVIASSGDAELGYVWEKGLRAVPTMAAVLGEAQPWMFDPRSTITATNVVHAEQSIEWHEPIAATGAVIARSRVEEIYDKGAAKGAIMVVRRVLHDAVDDRKIATLLISALLRSDGGFGGTAVAPKALPVPADRPPDWGIELETRPEQALIYRLSGDYYPLHVDPAFARNMGFERPILHGLATYGFAARAILRLLCDEEPSRLKQLDVRFTAPVYPGDTLLFEIWRPESGIAAFQAKVGDRVVLGNGRARITDSERYAWH